MREITYSQALNEALRDCMQQDERVVLLGEDIGCYGGIFQVTKSLQDDFGSDRSAPSLPDEPVRIMPVARKLAKEKGLDISNITATGPDRVILLHDVETALTKTAPKASTMAKRYAENKGISLKGLEGSGVRGRIMRYDVQQTLRDAKTPALGKIIPMDSMRRAIARRMSESAFTAPHSYFFSNPRSCGSKAGFGRY